MSPVNPGAAGATRSCPHRRDTFLESAGVCPACRHKLRFSKLDGVTGTPATVPPRGESSFGNPAGSGAWEHSMVLTIRNERSEEIARKPVGVGAMQPNGQRTFILSVEMNPAAVAAKQIWHQKNYRNANPVVLVKRIQDEGSATVFGHPLE